MSQSPTNGSVPDRYFVDERAGCITVRDRLRTDPEYQGLHSDTEGVVEYWMGQYDIGHHTWYMPKESVEIAHQMCNDMNEREWYGRNCPD